MLQQTKILAIRTVSIEKFRKIPQPKAVTSTCLVCSYTCHANCGIPNDDEKNNCSAMTNGYCTVCPQKCHWQKHANLPYRFEYYTENEVRTDHNLKKQHESAKTSKEQVKEMIQRNEHMLQQLQVEVFSLIKDVAKSIERLNDIALKPNPLTEIEYIDILIQSEKSDAKSGWQRRVEKYQKLRKEAEILKKIPDMRMKDSKDNRSWWSLWSS